ncbi:MAG TPA: cupin domain-containing protein [Candidatus Merdenecus merdavium]|nr:cupin domain-containing protein [Candidatus Merdenecus merdavium]
MSRYTFESIEYENQGKIRTFVTMIQSSNFHWHYEYELIVVLKGTILVRVDTGVFSMNPGDLILVNSRVIHSISCKSETNLSGTKDYELYDFGRKSGLDEWENVIR